MNEFIVWNCWRCPLVSFIFQVNRSILDYDSRPITIPKRLYALMEQEGLIDTETVTVVCPDGTIMTGFIHASVAGYGPYYQLRVQGGYKGDP